MSSGVGQSSKLITPNVAPSKKPLFKPQSGMSQMKVVGGSKPAMFGSASKAPSGGGAGLFKKPGMMGIGKKKFQLDVAAPSENDLKQIQKVENKLFAPKINLKKPAEGG